MAEDVNILNVGQAGSDGVASEATLYSLLLAMQKLAKSQSKDSGKDIKKIIKDLHKRSKAIEEDTEAVEDHTEAVEDATEETKKFSSSLGNVAKGSMIAFSRSLLSMTDELLSNSTAISDFARHLPVVGGYLDGIARHLDKSIDVYRTLNASGASFNNSIVEMKRVSANLELSLDEMSGFISSNSQSLRLLGGTVTEGVQRFALMNKTLKATKHFDDLKNLGFTVQEINEGMSDYIELQANMGTLQSKSNVELARGSAEYLEQIDKLAKVTGQTRKEAEEALKKQATDSSVRTLLNQFEEGSEQFKNLQMSLGLIDKVGGTVGDVFKDMLDGMPSTKETGQFFAMLGKSGPVMQQALTDIGKGANPQVLLDAMKSAGGDLEKFAQGDAAARKQLIDNLRASNPAMAEFLDVSNKLTAIGSMDLDKAKQEQQSRDETTEAMVKFDDVMRTASAKLQKLFIDSGVFEFITNNLVGAIEVFVNGITSFGSDTAKLAAAFGGLLVASTLFSKSLGGIGDLIKGSILDKFGKGKGAPPPGSPPTPPGGSLDPTQGANKEFGKGMYDLAKNFGKSIKRLLKDIGSGLGSAFASLAKGLGKGVGDLIAGVAQGIAKIPPTVVAGATYLSTAIGIIGAGVGVAAAAIGAGAWVIGKGISEISSGLIDFENINGDKIIENAKAMAAVGAALAAMGAGGVIGAVGNILGSFISSLGELAGVDTPLQKLEDFAKPNLPVDKIKQNAEALAAYGKAMASLGSGEALGAVGNIVGSIISSVGEWFGADSPIEKIQKFSEVKFKTKRIQNNADAVKIFAQAMVDIGAIEKVSLEDKFEDIDLDDMIDIINEFTENTFKLDIINNNKDSIISFSEAINAASKIPSMNDDIDEIDIDTIKEKLIEFQSMGLSPDIMKSNANAVIEFSNGLSSVGKIPDTINEIENIDIDVIREKVLEFQSMGLLADAVKSNTMAIQEFASGLTSIANVTFDEKSFSALNLKIIEDKVLYFQSLGLNSDIIKENSKAVQEFSSAITSIGSIPKLENIEEIGKLDFSKLTAAIIQFTSQLYNIEVIKSNTEAVSNFAWALDAISMLPEIDDNFEAIDLSQLMDAMKAFSAEEIDNKVLKNNYFSLLYFKNAAREMKNITELFNEMTGANEAPSITDTLTKSIVGMFGEEKAKASIIDIVNQMNEVMLAFTTFQFNTDVAQNNALAYSELGLGIKHASEVIENLSAIDSAETAIDAIHQINEIISLFTIEPYNIARVLDNTTALVDFSKAVTEISNIFELLRGLNTEKPKSITDKIFDSITSMFSDAPAEDTASPLSKIMEQLNQAINEFTKNQFDIDKIDNNLKALEKYQAAMQLVSDLSSSSGNIKPLKIDGLFGNFNFESQLDKTKLNDDIKKIKPVDTDFKASLTNPNDKLKPVDTDFKSVLENVKVNTDTTTDVELNNVTMNNLLTSVNEIKQLISSNITTSANNIDNNTEILPTPQKAIGNTEQLNMLMQQVVEILTEMHEFNEGIERNTRRIGALSGNVAVAAT